MLPSEEDLLASAKAGNREAIAELVTAHQAVVRGYLARLAPDPVEADDLAQEVFLAALKSLERVDTQLGFRPYLLGIARNLARTAWRKRLQHAQIFADKIFEVLSARCPRDEPSGRSATRITALRDCMQRLTPKAREVVQRHYADEQRCDEIALELGAEESSVRSTLTRARYALRDCIEPKLRELSS